MKFTRLVLVLCVFSLIGFGRSAFSQERADIPVPHGPAGYGKDVGQAMDTGSECKTSADCTGITKTFCAKPTGHCDAGGKCRPQPDFCIQIWDPVCGCDGKTYSNWSCAAVAGVNVKDVGKCK